MRTQTNEEIAREAADEFIGRLRQWLGFPLTKYQEKALQESYQSAIEKATAGLLDPDNLPNPVVITGWQEEP